MERKDLFISFEIGSILTKVVRDEPLTVHEHSTLESWLKQDDRNRKYFQNLKDENHITDSIKVLYQTDSNQQFKLVEQKIRKQRITKLIHRISIAAGFMIFFGAGFWYLTNSQSSNQQNVESFNNDILPGSNKATITFSDGKIIDLKDKDGIKVSRNGIMYNDGTFVKGTENSKIAILSTPRGGQYHITLSDGTGVWLNSNSTLEYPITFDGNYREVRLSGEGYFEVYHDPMHPFLVQTNLQQVKVLGTTFNIRTYESRQYTTLLKGSVEIKSKGSTSTQKIKPNQQAIISDYSLTIKSVDALDFIAWKEGKISSSSITLLELSKEIERWYDVDFKFEQDFKNNESAFLTINKNEKLSSVLKVIEKTYGVKAEIHGKEVSIR